MLHKEILDLFQEFQDVYNDLHGKWEVYKEIDKQARLQVEYDQVKTAVNEATELVGEYEDFLPKQQASLHAHEEEDKPRLSKEREPVGANVSQEIDKLISQLDNSLADIGRRPRGIYSKLGTHKDHVAELPTQMSETEPSTEQAEWLSPDVHKEAVSVFGQERRFSHLKNSTPKVSTAADHENDHLMATYNLVNAGQGAQLTHSTPNDDGDPFKGLTRLPIPKSKGDKRLFEAWYAGFHQLVGRHKVPSEQKLLRLYRCLEGEALHTVQNLCYSTAAYDVAIARLV